MSHFFHGSANVEGMPSVTELCGMLESQLRLIVRPHLPTCSHRCQLLESDSELKDCKHHTPSSGDERVI